MIHFREQNVNPPTYVCQEKTTEVNVDADQLQANSGTMHLTATFILRLYMIPSQIKSIKNMLIKKKS